MFSRFNEIREKLQNDFPNKSFSFKDSTLTIDKKFELKLDIDESMDDLKKFHKVDPLDEIYNVVKSEVLSINT